MGEEIEDWAAHNKWIFLNDGKPTQVSGESKTAPDGSLVPANKFEKVTWTVTQEIGTENLRIFIEFAGQEERRKLPRRHNFNDFNEMDKQKFQQLFLSTLEEKKVGSDKKISLEKEAEVFT